MMQSLSILFMCLQSNHFSYTSRITDIICQRKKKTFIITKNCLKRTQNHSNNLFFNILLMYLKFSNSHFDEQFLLKLIDCLNVFCFIFCIILVSCNNFREEALRNFTFARINKTAISLCELVFRMNLC